jgi:MFS family permease
MTVVFFLVAPVSGKLTGRLPLRVPLLTGLVLIGSALLLMRGVSTSGPWTDLLPGFVVGGIGMGIISPALAAAMVSVLPVERSGLASGINNTFRQLGIAMGTAALGAIFQLHAGHEVRSPAGIVEGLDAVLLIAALVAFGAAVVAWPLLGPQRSAR